MKSEKVLKNLKTNIILVENELKDYALTELGLMKNEKIIIEPKGKNGEYTEEQLDMINTIVDWYYSVDWIEQDEDFEEENIFELINEQCYYDDKLFN